MSTSRKPSGSKSVGPRNSNSSIRSPNASAQSYALVPLDDPSGNESDTTSASEAETTHSGTSINTTVNNDNPIVYKIQSLSALELKAFDIVKTGDLEGLKAVIQSPEFVTDADINNTDKCGFTLLHYAVIHQYEHIVDFFMIRGDIFLFDTVFYAILEENVEIVKKLTDYGRDNADRLQNTPERDSDFSKSMTPLMLACKLGSFEMIDLFYKGGDRLTWCQDAKAKTSMYHDECICNMCIGPKGLEDDYERLSLWQAFCNPVYITFMAGEKNEFDPIQEAFFLIKLLKEKVIPYEPVFYLEYIELADKLEEYTVDMMNMCRNNFESEIMLMAPRDNKECSEKYPRLRWALDLKLENFVVHSHTQSVLYKWWAGDGWPAWIGMHPAMKLVHLLSRLILFIPVSILLLFDRDSTFGRFFSIPVNIFLNSLAAYVVFLIVLIVQLVYPYQRCNTPNNYKIDAECDSKGPPRIGSEWLVILFVLGFALNSLKHFWPAKQGFFRYKWNVWNLMAQGSFFVAFIFWGLSYLEWQENLSVTNGVDPEIPRHMWRATDPILIAEAFLALATMLSVGRILQFVQVEPNLGPLQVGLGRVINKFFTTGIYFAFVLFAFAAGLSGLYKGYLNIKDENGKEVATKVQDDFAYFFGTTKNLYFGLFGLINRGAYLIELDDIELANGTTVHNHHYINQAVGKCMAVAFHIFAVVMMMSVLVAFLFNAFGDAQENVLRTWKYTRTEMYLYYGLETAIPSPFNLLIFFNVYYYSRCSKKSAIAAKCSSKFCCYYQERESKQEAKNRRNQYFLLINRFRLKYLEMIQTRRNEDPANADDVKEIYEELEQLQALMQEKGLEAPNDTAMNATKDTTVNSVFSSIAEISDGSTPPRTPKVSSPRPGTSAAALASPRPGTSAAALASPRPGTSAAALASMRPGPSKAPTRSGPFTTTAAVEVRPGPSGTPVSPGPGQQPKPAAISKSAINATTPPSKVFAPFASPKTPPGPSLEMKPLASASKTVSAKGPVLGSPTASSTKPSVPSPTVSTLKPVVAPPTVSTLKPLVASPKASASKPLVASPTVSTLKPLVGSPTASTSTKSSPAPPKADPSVVEIVPPTLPPKGSSVAVSATPSKAVSKSDQESPTK